MDRLGLGKCLFVMLIFFLSTVLCLLPATNKGKREAVISRVKDGRFVPDQKSTDFFAFLTWDLKIIQSENILVLLVQLNWYSCLPQGKFLFNYILAKKERNSTSVAELGVCQVTEAHPGVHPFHSYTWFIRGIHLPEYRSGWWGKKDRVSLDSW